MRNSEDKLCAAESTKQMLQKELSAYEVTLKKMSSDLEVNDILLLKKTQAKIFQNVYIPYLCKTFIFLLILKNVYCLIG